MRSPFLTSGYPELQLWPRVTFACSDLWHHLQILFSALECGTQVCCGKGRVRMCERVQREKRRTGQGGCVAMVHLGVRDIRWLEGDGDASPWTFILQTGMYNFLRRSFVLSRVVNRISSAAAGSVGRTCVFGHLFKVPSCILDQPHHQDKNRSEFATPQRPQKSSPPF